MFSLHVTIFTHGSERTIKGRGNILSPQKNICLERYHGFDKIFLKKVEVDPPEKGNL